MPKSKSKKRKLTQSHPYTSTNNHHQKSNTNSSNNTNLTHEEIWDDSALLRSWDEAVAEYEFYHSIHARGEDVDEVLRQHHAANDESDAEDGEVIEGAEEGKEHGGEVNEDGEVDDANGMKLDVDNRATITASTNAHDLDTSKGGPTVTAIPQPELPIPDTTTDNNTTSSNDSPKKSMIQTQLEAQNQTLENIKMAYYWAGYYSGLYDTQRQAGIEEQPTSQSAAGAAIVDKEVDGGV